jgi:hypothetical protein
MSDEEDRARRRLLIGGVGLVRGRVAHAGPVMAEICDAWEPVLREIGYLDQAPFKTVSLVIRFGRCTSASPELSRVDRKNEELPASFELPMETLRSADRVQLRELFERVTELTLRHVAQTYGLPEPRAPVCHDKT